MWSIAKYIIAIGVTLLFLVVLDLIFSRLPIDQAAPISLVAAAVCIAANIWLLRDPSQKTSKQES